MQNIDFDLSERRKKEDYDENVSIFFKAVIFFPEMIL
jgi:hypothetical protein